MRTTAILLTLIAAVMCAMFASSCNVMEAIHQTSPNYRSPVLFSTPWFERARARRNLQQFEREWGVRRGVD